jgi:endonuclease/exonuclease/phosphatase (EEP) superfamily protein YafD
MGWCSTASLAAGTSEAERRREAEAVREEEGKGERTPAPSALDKAAPAWAAAATDGDQCLRALHHKRGHRVVTGSVASEVGTVTGTCG